MYPVAPVMAMTPFCGGDGSVILSGFRVFDART
jgi:hypothetical protein